MQSKRPIFCFHFRGAAYLRQGQSSANRLLFLRMLRFCLSFFHLSFSCLRFSRLRFSPFPSSSAPPPPYPLPSHQNACILYEFRMNFDFSSKKSPKNLLVPKNRRTFACASESCIFLLGYGVMVTLQILVLSFLVRVRVSQHTKSPSR